MSRIQQAKNLEKREKSKSIAMRMEIPEDEENLYYKKMQINRKHEE